MTILKIALHDTPEPEALTRAMEQAGEVLAYRFPAVLACRLYAEPVTGEPSRFEVRIELRLPQEQFILARAATTAAGALRNALQAVWSAPSMAFHLRHPGEHLLAA
jgi:hypothetical protein